MKTKWEWMTPKLFLLRFAPSIAVFMLITTEAFVDANIRSALVITGRYSSLIMISSIVISITSGYIINISANNKFRFARPVVAENIMLAIALLLFVTPLFQAWTTSEDPLLYLESNSLGGYLPTSDASGYYTGALELVKTGNITSFNQRRPLNVTWQAALETVVGWDFRQFLLLQTLIVGLSCYGLSRLIWKLYGSTAGCVSFFLMYMFARCYAYQALSEIFGLTLGASAFALLLYSTVKRHLWLFLCGITGVTIALTARAGSFFILPAFAFAAGFLFLKRGKFELTPVVASLGAIMVGFMIHMAPMAIHNHRISVGQSNFACVLYGMSKGGEGWDSAYKDLQSNGLSEKEYSAFILEKAVDNISVKPTLFIKGLARSAVIQATYIKNRTLSFYNGEPPSILLLLFGIGFLRYAIRSYRDRVFWLLACGLTGFAASLPFLADGRSRAIISTYPLIAIVIGLALSGLEHSDERQEDDRAKSADWSYIALPCAILLFAVFSCLVGPSVAQVFERRTPKPSVMGQKTDCGNGLETLVIDISKSVYMNVIPQTSYGLTFMPNVMTGDLMRTFPFRYDRSYLLDEEIVASFFTPNTIILAFGNDNKYHYVYDTTRIMSGGGKWISMCGAYSKGDATSKDTGMNSVFHVVAHRHLL